MDNNCAKFPPWLKARMPAGQDFAATENILRTHRLSTVCRSARCPNIGECWREKTATFMILGERCTRACRFCAVTQGQKPFVPDADEPRRIAAAVHEMGLHYVVITSVTRDDLSDGGAAHFARCATAISALDPKIHIEVLIPDFAGNHASLHAVATAPITVLNHNIEMIPRLYASLRPGADYHRSLALLRNARNITPTLATKSGIMVGLGETMDEVRAVIENLRHVGVQHLTVGQYLCPAPDRQPIARFVAPEEFDALRDFALHLGFTSAVCSPLARSSYHAATSYSTSTKS